MKATSTKATALALGMLVASADVQGRVPRDASQSRAPDDATAASRAAALLDDHATLIEGDALDRQIDNRMIRIQAHVSTSMTAAVRTLPCGSTTGYAPDGGNARSTR